MTKFSQFFKDSTGVFSASRLCFIFGTFGCFSLATLQFFGVGQIPTALYVVLATLASGGYAVSKYNDRLDITEDNSEYDIND